MNRLLVMILLVLPALAGAQKTKRDPFVRPALTPARLVNDFAGFLNPGEKSALENKLSQYYSTSSNTIVVITLDSLTDRKTHKKYSIDKAAFLYFNTWGIGDSIKNNGVLIMASRKERKVRIEVGLGLQTQLTNDEAKEIIEQDIVPNFKNGRFADGFSEAVESIMQQLGQEKAATQASTDTYTSTITPNIDTEIRTEKSSSSNYFLLIFFGVVAVILLGMVMTAASRPKSTLINRRGYYEANNYTQSQYTGGNQTFLGAMLLGAFGQRAWSDHNNNSSNNDAISSGSNDFFISGSNDPFSSSDSSSFSSSDSGSSFSSDSGSSGGDSGSGGASGD